MAKRRRKKQSNKLISFAIACIVIALCFVVRQKSESLQQENSAYEAQLQTLNTQLNAENARTNDLEEYSKYVKTKQFIEEVARDKLGLIYKDEKVFKADDK